MKPPYRVIVCGSRSWDKPNVLHARLNELLVKYKRLVIVHGGAEGADRAADDWCEGAGRNVGVERHRPSYITTDPKVAPLVRNEEMAKKGADLCLAFWDGESRGTAHMISQAVKHRIPVEIVPLPKP